MGAWWKPPNHEVELEPCTLITFNVCTLNDKGSGSELLSTGKVSWLDQQLAARKVMVAAIQEGRDSLDGQSKSKNYSRFHTARDAKGQAGNQIWLHDDWMPALRGVTVKSNRLMHITLSIGDGMLRVINAHAPCESAPEDIRRQWWDDFRECIAWEQRERTIIMGDMNARIATACSRCAGPHVVGKINENGHELITTCELYNMMIANSFLADPDACHTWTAPGTGGMKATIDHICVPQHMYHRVMEAKIDGDIDIATHTVEDHKAVMLVINMGKVRKKNIHKVHCKRSM
eukprot:3658843-Amphidinium_carterae.2